MTTKTKLSNVQEDTLVCWAINLADQNLALTSKLIHEQALLICHSINMNGTLGISLTKQFLDQHDNELWHHWSCPFDCIRAMSANPVTISHYFQAYKSIAGENGKKIPVHCQFAYDESGVLHGHAQRTQVITSHTNKATKFNKGGNWELITFIPLISAARELIDSLVVFLGKLLCQYWIENNPGCYMHTCYFCPISCNHTWPLM